MGLAAICAAGLPGTSVWLPIACDRRLKSCAAKVFGVLCRKLIQANVLCAELASERASVEICVVMCRERMPTAPVIFSSAAGSGRSTAFVDNEQKCSSVLVAGEVQACAI